MRRPQLAVVAAACLASARLAVACGEQFPKPNEAALTDAAVDAGEDGAVDATAVVPRGSRVLGAGLDLGDPTFYADLLDLGDAGGHGVDVSFAWDEIERPYDAGPDAEAGTDLFAPGLHVVNLVLPEAHTSVALGALAVDVGGARVPADLAGAAFDDPALLARFDALLDYALPELRDVSIDVLLVGDRVNFGTDVARWNAFASFVGHAKAHAKALRPGLSVAFTVAPEVLSTAAAAPALSAADVTAIRWGLAGPATDLERVFALAPAGRPVIVVALGFPAVDGGGGEQARFVSAAFSAWDRSKVSRVSFAFLDDPSPETVAAAAGREGRSDPAFPASFGSLGLRDATGRPRPAFEALRREARARGF